MHILLLTSGYPSAWSPNQGIFFRDQAESLARGGQNQVGVIAVVPVSAAAVLKKKRGSFGLERSENNGVRTLIRTFPNIPRLHRYRMKKSCRLASKIIADYIGEFGKPDVIHLHGYQAGLQAVEAKKKHGIPCVVTEHSNQFIDDTVPKGLEPFCREIFTQANEAIAVSEAFAEVMTKRYGRKFRYIPNVVDTDVFRVGSSGRNAQFTFFNAAAFVKEKNHGMLLEAFARICEKHPEVVLKLAGSGPGLENAKELADKLKIAGKVEFLGLLPRREIVSEMQQMNAFVLSSTVETFGVVLIEALSCGKPVVSTKCFGPESIVTSPQLGILCERKTDDLADAMLRMIENYASYDSDAIRKYAVDNFSEEVVANRLMEVYRRVASGLNA
jgi:glycosyltransferase involved in cell wall biosynthesis